jgi:hypothetical protein
LRCIHQAITLKLCQFEESGAILAAMTTSIPESNQSGRNWDYRFCWLRDSFHTVRALNRLSETSTMVRTHGLPHHIPEFIIILTSLPMWNRLWSPLAGSLHSIYLQLDCGKSQPSTSLWDAVPDRDT